MFNICGIRQKQVGGNKLAEGRWMGGLCDITKGSFAGLYGLTYRFWEAAHPKDCSFLTSYHHSKIYIYVSKVNLLSHSPSNAMFSSPVGLSPSVSPLLCCPPPYPAEIRLYWQSFAAPNTWRLNLSFNSCDITEHPPSHLISFFSVRVYTRLGR